MTIFAHTTAKQKQNRAECSDETERPVQLRETAVNANPSHETILFITPKIRICRRIDKTLESIDNLDKDLDLKDKWLGIKKLKTNTRHNLTRRKTKKRKSNSEASTCGFLGQAIANNKTVLDLEYRAWHAKIRHNYQ